MTGGFQFVFIDAIIDSEETILRIREEALRLYREGKLTMEWSAEGTSDSKRFVAPIESILMETRRALKLKNPVKYGYIVRQSNMVRIA